MESQLIKFYFKEMKSKKNNNRFRADQICRLDGDLSIFLSPLFMIVIFRFTSLVTVGSKLYTFFYKNTTLQWTKN